MSQCFPQRNPISSHTFPKLANVSPRMFLKKNTIYLNVSIFQHFPKCGHLGMVNTPPMKMAMIGEWCKWMQMALFLSTLAMFEGSLEVKLPTIWTDEKHSQEEAQAWRKSEGRR